MSVAREHLAGAVVDGRFYTIGGRESGATSNLATVERYNPRRERWRRVPDLHKARSGNAASCRGRSHRRVRRRGGRRHDRRGRDVQPQAEPLEAAAGHAHFTAWAWRRFAWESRIRGRGRADARGLVLEQRRVSRRTLTRLDPAQGQHPHGQLPDRHGRPDRAQHRDVLLLPARRPVAGRADRTGLPRERRRVRRDPVRDHPSRRSVPSARSGAARPARDDDQALAATVDHPVHVDVHARRAAAPRREHAVPLDLRQQHRGLDGAAEVRRLLSAGRAGRDASARRSSTRTRPFRASGPAAPWRPS